MNNNLLASLREKTMGFLGGVDRRVEEYTEEQKRQIMDAAEVCKALETDGGKIILNKLSEIEKEFTHYSPRDFVKISEQGMMQVDTLRVAQSDGGYEMLQTLLSWIQQCKVIVQEAAKKNTQKENK